MRRLRLLNRTEVRGIYRTFCIFLLILSSILLIAAIGFYDKFGKSLGYYTMVIMPLLSIIAGGVAIAIKKYWPFVVAIFHITCFVYVLQSAGTSILGFVPFFLLYIALSIWAGVSFQKLTVFA